MAERFVLGKPVNGVLDATRKAGARMLTLRAKNMRLDREGYARCHLSVFVDTTPVYSNADVEVEDEDARHKVALTLYGTRTINRDGTPSKTGREAKFGPEIVAAFSQEEFEHELMLWSRAAWNAYIGPSAGALVEGDEAPSAPPWAVPGLVMRGATGIWAGDAGAGKSTHMRLTCQSIANGVTDVIPTRVCEPTIWINAEEPPEEHTRQLGNVNQALGLPRTTPMFTIHARGMRVEDVATRLEKAVRETKAKHVFIDSLSRLAQGMSLNDNNTATLLVDTIAGVTPDCSVNWIGHTGWGNRERLAGSRHFENAARVMVLVQSRYGRTPFERGVRTRVDKANGAVLSDPMYWTFRYHEQFGLVSAEMSCEEDWPALRCGWFSGEGKPCDRQTWDGVLRDGSVRCSRHRDDGVEP